MVFATSVALVLPDNPDSSSQEFTLCIIRDLTNANLQSKFSLNLPSSTTCEEFVGNIGKRLGYVIGTFNILFENVRDSQSEEISFDSIAPELTIGKLTSASSARRNNFTVTELNGNAPVLEESHQEKMQQGVNLSSGSYWSNASQPATASDREVLDESSSTISDNITYVGLVNQAMTCYLNSLLQSLYMTPEFRNAIYEWAGGEDQMPAEAAKSIPYQLQRLFLQLQTSHKKAVETTDITKSFGWDSSEAWQQHDVQELCRVMFDALEKTWKHSSQEQTINRLYQGKLKDYVKCRKCDYESARTDTYLDIPLVIRPFGSNRSYKSVEEALAAFVEPETLDGNNQYFCEKCNEKTDAFKGLKFLTFPYLLTLQLKRFDFDYSSMSRIKLNDRVSFPEVLNLSQLLDTPTTDTVHTATNSTGVLVDESQVDSREEADAVDEGIDVQSYTSNTASESSSCASAADSCSDCGHTSSVQHSGCHDYQLFSIMIHSGSAAGGHYYVYIRALGGGGGGEGRWLCFNDQHVTSVTRDDIRRMYGGAPGCAETGAPGYAEYGPARPLGYTSTYSSSTNAYMLMYRKIDKSRNADFLEVDSFPDHLKRELEKIHEFEEAERRKKQLDLCTFKFKLFCFHPVCKKQLESRFHVHQDRTLTEATLDAWKHYNLESEVPLDCVRLVRYDECHDSIEESYDTRSHLPLHLLFGMAARCSHLLDLYLEVKRPEHCFLPYQPGGVTVKLYRVELDDETIGQPVTMRASLTQTVFELKNDITQVLGLPPESAMRMRCVLERCHGEMRPLFSPTQNLKAEMFTRSNKVFIECDGEPETTTPNMVITDPDTDEPEQRDESFTESRLYQILDRYRNTIRLHVTLPPCDTNSTSVDTLASGDRHSPNNDEPSTRSPNPEHASPWRVSTPDARHSDNQPITTAAAVHTCLFNPDQLSREPPSDYPLTGDVTPPPTPPSTPTTPISAPATPSLSSPRVSPVSSPCYNDDVFPVNSEVNSAGLDSGEPRPDQLNKPTRDHLTGELLHGTTQRAEGFGDQITHSAAQSSELDELMRWFNTSEPHNDSTALDPLGSTAPDPLGSTSLDQLDSTAPVKLDSTAADKLVTTPTSSGQCTSNTEFESGSSERYTSTDESREEKREESMDEARSPADEDFEEEDEKGRRFFSATMHVDTQTDERSLTVYVDRRMTLRQFKVELTPYVGVSVYNFKVFRVYSNNQEFETTRLNELLSAFGDDGKISIKLGRALRKNEHRIKVFLFQPNEIEPIKPLFEIIVCKGMTVLDSKRLIVRELADQLDEHLPINRCRLRKKAWRNPGSIYLDHMRYDADINVLSANELLVERIQGDEPLTSNSQISVYTRRWHRSTLTLDDRFKEIKLTETSVEHFKQQLSSICDIEPANLEFAQGTGTFPCLISVLDMESNLEWRTGEKLTAVNVWPLYLCDDGTVFYYRDRTEKLMELSAERKKELERAEHKRISQPPRVRYSPRKEHALKIYTDGSPRTRESRHTNY